MSENDESRWRTGLEARGADWVRSKLRERAGSPDDEIFDVVFTGRNPSRAFCQAWCAEQDNKVFRMSGTTKIAWVLAIVLVVFIVKAFIAWTSDHTVTPAGRPPMSQTAR
jgi:hypothetical protein